MFRTWNTHTLSFVSSLAYFKLKWYSDTREHLQKLEELSKPHPHYVGNASLARYYLGEIDFTQTKYTDAARHYTQAITYFSTKMVAERFRVIPPSRSTIYTRRAGVLRNNSQLTPLNTLVLPCPVGFCPAVVATTTADSKKDKLSAHKSLGNLFQNVRRECKCPSRIWTLHHQTVRRAAKLCLPWPAHPPQSPFHLDRLNYSN